MALKNMITIELLVALCTLISFIIGFLTAVIKLGHSATLEKYYKKTIVEIIEKPGYLPKSIAEIPTEIIVDTKDKLSPLRIFLKKKIAQLRRKKVPPVILIFSDFSEEEQKAFIIEKALASSLTSDLLDLDFLESLILYLAYKYAYESNEIEKEVVTVIRRDFEKSKYRNHVVTLDSLDFSTSTILNPPPEEQPLLRNIILPMIREKEKELRRTGVNLSIIEKWKSFFMTLIHEIYSKNCAVILIGVRPPEQYLDMLNEALQGFDNILICARGTYIRLMDQIIQAQYDLESSKPINERIINNYNRVNITGWWEFPGEKRVRCKWVILTKTKFF